MITALNAIMDQSGAQRLSISIDKSTNKEELVVVLSTEFGGDIEGLDQSLRQALSRPLVLTGFAEDIDSEMESNIFRFGKNLSALGINFKTNADEAATAPKATPKEAPTDSDNKAPSEKAKTETKDTATNDDYVDEIDSL